MLINTMTAGLSACTFPTDSIRGCREPSRPLVKDPISALTHFLGFVFAILAMPLLIYKGTMAGLSGTGVFSLVIFMLSMVFLYGASSAYHTFPLTGPGENRLKKLDHMMIFVLIAGSYTPICVIPLWTLGGHRLLILVWSVALVGMVFKAFWVTCPKWVSSVIYIGMGWLCLTAFPAIIHTMSLPSFIWLLTGGILYTAGGVIYALKLPLLASRFPGFGAHELFHLFVLGGSACQYVAVYLLL